jgi:HPt (histidine-containing phosphotransfer) domain-containing protein
MIMHAFKHLDLTYLESLIGDDTETMAVIFSTLLEEVPEELEKMEILIANKDWHTFHEVSHKFKSTLAYVGNDIIFDSNQDMMMNARNMSNLDKIPALFEIVKRKWQEIRPEVEMALSDIA